MNGSRASNGIRLPSEVGSRAPVGHGGAAAEVRAEEGRCGADTRAVPIAVAARRTIFPFLSNRPQLAAALNRKPRTSCEESVQLISSRSNPLKLHDVCRLLTRSCHTLTGRAPNRAN